MIVVLLMVAVKMGGANPVVEKVCLPADMARNTWVILEYSPVGRELAGEAKYIVPKSGYLKVPFKAPSVPSKVLLKVANLPFVDASRSRDVHAMRREGAGSATTDGASTWREFLVFFYGDERQITDRPNLRKLP